MPQLAPDTCHVWWACLTSIHLEVEPLLAAEERARLRAFRSPEARDGFAAACAITRLASAAYLHRLPADVTILRTCRACGRPHGKPRLGVPSPIEFSISHSGHCVVVAFARTTPIGVDVEAPWPERPFHNEEVADLAQQALTPTEAATLCAMDQTEQARGFLRYWTRKEAVLKATGQGLNVPMREVSVTGPNEPAQLTGWSMKLHLSEPVTLRDLEAGPDHVASLAMIGASHDLVVLDGCELLVRHRYAQWRRA